MSRDQHKAEFEEFVLVSWRRLGKAAYALTGNKDDAEDLLQSVLERTCARWSRIVHENPHAYVRRALVHGYVDGWRRKRRVRRGPDRHRSGRGRCWAAGPGWTASRIALDLTRLLAELSDRERAMVVLRYYLDCSVQEVAPSSAARSAPSRAPARGRSPRLRVPAVSIEGNI